MEKDSSETDVVAVVAVIVVVVVDDGSGDAYHADSSYQ